MHSLIRGSSPPILTLMPPKMSSQQHGHKSGFDAMPSPAAANPASLLWAQQLKCENGYLLGRMDGLEAQCHAYNARIKSAETAADVARVIDQKVRDLGSRVDAMCDDENNQKGLLDRIVGENHAKTERASEIWHEIHQKVSTLDMQHRSMQTDIQQSSSKYDLAATSIDAIQATLGSLEGSVNSLHQNAPKNDSALVHRLDALELCHGEEVEQTRRMHDMVTSLERTCQTVTARNSELQAEVTRLEAIIETKARVLPTTERFSGRSVCTQTPASPMSNEKIHPNPLAESPAYNAHQRRLTKRPSVLIHSSQQNAQVLPFSLRTQHNSDQTPGPDISSLPSTAQRRTRGAGAAKKIPVDKLKNTQANAIKKLPTSSGRRGSRYQNRNPKISELQSARVTRSQATDTQSICLMNTPSSRTTRSQANNTQVTESLRTLPDSPIRSRGQCAQITTSLGPPLLPTTHGRPKDTQVAKSSETPTTHTTRSRLEKPQAVNSPVAPSIHNTRRQAKQPTRKKSMSVQPSKNSAMRPPREDSRKIASAKPSRVSALKRPPQHSQSSPGAYLVKIPLGKACHDCRKRRIKCRHRGNGEIENHFQVSARLGKRPADESTRSVPSSEPPKKKPRREVQQLEDLDAFLNAGD